MTQRKRAGFWRRAAALCVDSVIVLLPIQLVAAGLFALTAGSVQFTGGAMYITRCDTLSQLPQNLVPAPPVNPTEIKDCHESLFGADMGRHLIVKRVTEAGKTKETVSQTYTLDRNGDPIHAFSLNLIAYLALIGYLIRAKARSGATHGDRAAGIATIGVSSNSNDATPPQLKSLLIRYLILAGPYGVVHILREVDSSETIGMTTDIVTSGLLGVLYAGFYLTCVVQIIMRRDPLYDRIAGTAIVERAA